MDVIEAPVIQVSSLSYNYLVMNEREVKQEIFEPHVEQALVNPNQQGSENIVSLEDNYACDSFLLP